MYKILFFIGMLFVTCSFANAEENMHNISSENWYAEKTYNGVIKLVLRILDKSPDNVRASGNATITCIKYDITKCGDDDAQKVINKTSEQSDFGKAYCIIEKRYHLQKMSEKALVNHNEAIKLRPNAYSQNKINKPSRPFCKNEDLIGKWSWEKNSDKGVFYIDIGLANGVYVGRYCAVMYGGNRIDCALDEYSFTFNKIENEIIVNYTCNFSGETGKAKITLIGKKLKWEILTPPDGECYAPARAILIKDK